MQKQIELNGSAMFSIGVIDTAPHEFDEVFITLF